MERTMNTQWKGRLNKWCWLMISIGSPNFSKFWPHFSLIPLRPPSDCLFKLAELSLILLFKYMCTFNCDHLINQSDCSGWWGVRECLCYLLWASWLAEAEQFDLVLHEWRSTDSIVTDTFIKEELLCLFCASAPLRRCKVVTGFFFHFQSLSQKLWITNVTFIMVIGVVIDILQYWKVMFICLFSCSTEIIMVITDTNTFLSFLLKMLFWPCMLNQPLWILIYICNTI